MAEKKLKFADNVVFREEPGGAILFNVDTGDIRIVEDVAWGISDLIDKGRTRTQILAELIKKYPDVNSLESDLDEFLDSLRNTNCLVAE